MNYQENEGILLFLLNFRDLSINDSLVICPFEGMDHEDVEHRVYLLKNFFLD